jgi:hypothetical protein
MKHSLTAALIMLSLSLFVPHTTQHQMELATDSSYFLKDAVEGESFDAAHDEDLGNMMAEHFVEDGGDEVEDDDEDEMYIAERFEDDDEYDEIYVAERAEDEDENEAEEGDEMYVAEHVGEVEGDEAEEEAEMHVSERAEEENEEENEDEIYVAQRVEDGE